MELVLLSGGSGKRLWPLSNDIRSKQFLKVIKDEEGNMESMVQRVYRQIMKAELDTEISLVTSRSQVEQINSQLGEKVSIIVEPERRNTFPAILLSAAYLYYEKKCSLNETVIVLPVDPYVDIDYFNKLREIDVAVQNGISDIVLMGVEPNYPSEKYGYIIPAEIQNKINRVAEFKEKPDKIRAENYIKQGGLWNSGIFALKLSYLMNILKEKISCDCYADVVKFYHQLEKTSFDYAVLEKSDSISVISYKGEWKDLGTWNELTTVMDGNFENTKTIVSNCSNTHVINELNIPLVALGLNDTVIVASPDGILISEKDCSTQIKKHIEPINVRPMYEERSWGEYEVLDSSIDIDGIMSLTKRKRITRNKKISKHEHKEHAEVWIIISGKCKVKIDNAVCDACTGNVFSISKGSSHELEAITDTVILEIQTGFMLND